MIGIYGGTFDPVHYGHLRTALEVQEAAGLDEVRFIPCREPPHRQAPEASPEQRLNMLELALSNGEPGFRLDTRELDRPGPSYMVDTLASLRREIGSRPLCLIVGLDAFHGLPSWHRWRELFDLAHVIVMRRSGSEAGFSEQLAPLIRERMSGEAGRLKDKAAGAILLVDVTQLDISATRIRDALKSGKSPRYLTPDPVLDFIRAARLYAPGG
jgi:nicotinate-nucleotide adenylyltransferase